MIWTLFDDLNSWWRCWVASECPVTYQFKKCYVSHSFCRNREIKRIKGRVRAGNSFAFICNDISELEHSNQVNLPRVTIIMPLKGFGEHNLHNWRSQVGFFLFSFSMGVRGIYLFYAYANLGIRKFPFIFFPWIIANVSHSRNVHFNFSLEFTLCLLQLLCFYHLYPNKIK